MAKVNLIWQRDANAIALAALAQAAHPPLVLNLTGPAVPVRWIAGGVRPSLERRAGVQRQPSRTPRCSRTRAQCVRRFGRPPVDARK